ncbi:MAG: OmpH family outer membrane protein [Spirochaetales bacterium]|nr:OmpH family outer membrane protein [Spirochaetales bacterium]
MDIKKIVLITLVTLVFVCSLGAIENIPKIGLVDIDFVAEKYLKESRAFRDLGKLQESFQEKIAEIKEDITKLEAQRLRLVEEKNQTDGENDLDDQILKKETEIFEKQNYLAEYKRIKQKELDTRFKNLRYNDDFVKSLYSVIKNIASEKGYSLVLDKKDPSVIYFVPEIDITDMVVDRLINR